MLKQMVCMLTTVLHSINVLSNMHMKTLGLKIHQSLYHHHSFSASYSKWYKRDNIANPQLLQILLNSEQIHMVLRNSNS